MISLYRPSQIKAYKDIVSKKRCLLIGDMGTGKTRTVITAMAKLGGRRNLIAAPLAVAKNVWPAELKTLGVSDKKYSVITGTLKQREKEFERNTPIQIINYENLKWYIEHHLKNKIPLNIDTLVFDESTMVKNISSIRTKCSLKLSKNENANVILITGTPAPNSVQDLYSQMLIVDRGERLGKTITSFRNRYMKNMAFGQSYPIWKPLPHSHIEIGKKCMDKVVRLKNPDYISSEHIIYKKEIVQLPDKDYKKMQELIREYIVELESGDVIPAKSGAVLVNKLRQLSNGFAYDENGKACILNSRKFDRLKAIIQDNPSQNFLVAYSYRCEEEWLKTLPGAEVFGTQDTEKITDKWNRGDIRVLLLHPAKGAHGLNLQYGGHSIIWYGLTWSLEHYHQFNARLNRPGQTRTVSVSSILSNHPIESKVLKVLSEKNSVQSDILKLLKNTA